MSTVDMLQVSSSLQTLVNARLDAIDRMLLGRVSRQERLDVVGEVEGRIHELLHERCGAGVEPSREDVLAVLARLDPPEAYLPEHDDAGRANLEPRERSPALATASNSSRAADRTRIAWYSGLLGVASLGMVPLIIATILAAPALNSVLLVCSGWLGGTLIMFGGGLASVAFAIHSRLITHWALIGAITGTISIMLSIASSVFLLIELLP